jgi:hypothetical protein
MKYRWFYYRRSSLIKIIFYRILKFFLVKARYIKYFIQYNKDLADIRKLKDSKIGKSAFIFANGPSLNKLSIKKIKRCKFDIFAVNKYINSNFPEPNFYVLSDLGYFIRNKIEPENSLILRKLLKNAAITIFVPAELKKIIKKEKVEGNKTISFCDLEDIYSDNNLDVTKPRNYINLTAFKALAIGTYFGYSKIYISGFDNSFFFDIQSDINNNLFYYLRHFYKSKGKKINYNKMYNTFSYGEIMANDYPVYLDFDLFLNQKSTKIINLDKSSLITAFTKKHKLDLYKKKDNL